MAEQAKQLLRDVPRIHTIVLLDEGMGSTKAGRTWIPDSLDAWVSTCSMLANAFWEIKPTLHAVAYDPTGKVLIVLGSAPAHRQIYQWLTDEKLDQSE